MTEIKIGKAVLKIDMHIPNPQGYLSYQAANELQLKLQYNQEWMEEAEKEIKRLNAYIKELRMDHIETDKMLNMDTSALHTKKQD
jgi:hypothetical protein